MPTQTIASFTPHYVLNGGDGRIGPRVMQFDAENECAPIYGFSEKGAYDQFLANSELPLTPYPLVKGYLRDQIDAPGNGLKLIVLDAVGPHDPCLRAATMEAVLEAQENRTACVAAGYRLTLDQEAGAYRVEKATE